MILEREEIREPNIDGEALRVFLKAIDLAGGPQTLAHKRNLTWLPSLLQASYMVVLAEHGKIEDEIAQFLGTTRQTVRNALRADVEAVKRKVSQEGLTGEEEETRTHTAGGLAKWAYQEIKAGNEHIPFLAELYEEFSRALGIEWPIAVLQRIKGLRFPVTKETLAQRLQGLAAIKGVPIETILQGLPNTIKNPAQLLHEIKEAIGGARET
jgi:probable regulatory domain-containing protein